MNIPEENVISDGSNPEDNHKLGLPLAAIICIVIVIYGLFMLICIFVRQVVLNRRPLATLESLHCCECLLFLPRPAIKLCDIPCGQSGKPGVAPCQLDFKWLWAALPAVRCRLPESPAGPSCWPPPLPAVQCPTSVHCCGLEIRRHTRPGMVDASVPCYADTLPSPASGAGRPTPRGTGLELTESHHHSQHRADSSPYSTRSAALGAADSGDFTHHAVDLGDYGRHMADSGDCSDWTADSSKYSQHRAVLDPGVLLESGPPQPSLPGARLQTGV